MITAHTVTIDTQLRYATITSSSVFARRLAALAPPLSLVLEMSLFSYFFFCFFFPPTPPDLLVVWWRRHSFFFPGSPEKFYRSIQKDQVLFL
jgi:hypothetical protein